jgi:NAD(P)-dependent dehydrogenase (short-subunit alcohol dehydrogenase family)
MIDDVLGYNGKRVVVTGSASGMGAATARILVDLGAEVMGLDVGPTEAPVKASLIADLRDKAAIDDAVRLIGGPVDAIFSVAGLPGAPFSDLDTLLVNFVGARHLIESLVPSMPEGSGVACVASTAGLGWQIEVADLLPLVTTEDFDAGKAWCEEHGETIAAANSYAFSKKIINTWVAWRSVTLLPRGVRLNCTNPGPTNTGMMPAFEAQHGAATIDAFVGPARRRSTAEEQAWPLLFLNSPRSSYVAGEAFHTDAGFTAAVVTGQLDAQLPTDLAAATGD